MQTVSSGSSSDGAPGLDAADERLGVGDGRRPAERRRRGQLERQRGEDPHAHGARNAAGRRARAGSGRSAPRPPARRGSRAGLRTRRGQVERQRRADQRNPPCRARARARARAPTPAPSGSPSSESAEAARTVSAPEAASSEAGPPCRTVSAAPTVTTASVSASARAIRSGTSPLEPRSTSPGSSASWTTTSPRKRSANSGVTRLSTTRRPGPAGEPGSDEDRLSVGRDADPLELVRGGGERGLPRVARRCRERAAPAARRGSSPGRRAGRASRASRRRAGTGARRERRRRRRRSPRRAAGAVRSRPRPRPHPRRPAASRKKRDPAHRVGTIALRHVPEDAHRGRARARRRARPRVRALPRRRQQPRLPRLLRAAGGAGDERGLRDRRAARVHEHALQAALRLPAEGRRGRVGHAARPPGGALGRVQGGPPADAGSAPRAVPVLPADRRGVRLPQPRVRGLGGRRRDRDARHPRGRGRNPDLRRLDRPRRLPARHRERLPDDDPARRRGRERLHAGAGRGEARDHGRQGARLHRPEGRPVRQHRRRPGDRRQDRVAADRRSTARSRECSSTWTS